jgi:hypothetical protein
VRKNRVVAARQAQVRVNDFFGSNFLEREIDQQIYKLYGLANEEIRIVEAE